MEKRWLVITTMLYRLLTTAVDGSCFEWSIEVSNLVHSYTTPGPFQRLNSCGPESDLQHSVNRLFSFWASTYVKNYF